MATAQPNPPPDSLGRTTPRGTVLGFLKAARKGDYDAAVQYLNTQQRGKAAADLAQQLSVVMDRRLPARLNELSDRPEGSLAFPAKPDQDLVGTVTSESGSVDLLLERVDRRAAGRLWLFSATTLRSIPDLYAEIAIDVPDSTVSGFLRRTRIARIPLAQWLAVLVGLPAFHLAMVLLNRLLSRLAGRWRRSLRGNPHLRNPIVLPGPVRLLLLVGVIRWALTYTSMPLMTRQIWSTAANILTIAASVWAFFALTAWTERYIRGRLLRVDLAGRVAILRLMRWGADLLVLLGALLVGLYFLGVNPNTTLAGLGVGGIAVALAAQKTLENVIGGASMVFDAAVRVGDLLKVGETMGTVEDIGLRSTRLRTFNGTLVTLPNGQIANVSLENLSLRDRFWFHHTFGLHYGTTVAQMRSVLEGLTNLFQQHPLWKPEPMPVRLLRFGAYSLDLEISAQFAAQDWTHFLELQQQLLLQIVEVIETKGARLAIPAQTSYLSVSSGSGLSASPDAHRDAA